jgi:RNA polymerase sigma-70 factor (ECF subfamily)
VRGSEAVPKAGDEELRAAFAAVVAGDLAALEGIYEACASQLFGLAFWRTGSREDAADAVQEVFVSLACAARSLAGVRNPRAYLLAMTHSAACKILRRRRVTVDVEDAVLEPVISDPSAAVDVARVSCITRRLSTRQREAVFLCHFAGLTFAEIGSVTRVPTFTAASRYRLGMERLRKLMGVES